MANKLKKPRNNFVPKKERNYFLLFKTLSELFPGWTDYNSLVEMHNFKFILERDMWRLYEDGLLDKQDMPNEEAIRDGKVTPVSPHYRLTSEGFSFLNSMQTGRTNRVLLFLTISLIVMGLIQIALVIWQIVLQYNLF